MRWARKPLNIPPELRDELIGVMLAGLEAPPEGLDTEACAQIRSWCQVNLVGAPQGPISYGVPEGGLPLFITLLRCGLRRLT